MAGPVSKNARREGAHTLLSKWGGNIKMKTVFKDGKMKHVAVCEKSGNTARKPKKSTFFNGKIYFNKESTTSIIKHPTKSRRRWILFNSYKPRDRNKI